MTPDQRLDLLLEEGERKQREDAAEAALARVRQGHVASNMQPNQCRPSGQASSSSGHVNPSSHPSGSAGQVQTWQQTNLATNPVNTGSVGSHPAVPPLSLGGSPATGPVHAARNGELVDKALAEQMSLDWHEDEEKGPQPEDEPIDEACSAEKFSIGTPLNTVPIVPTPMGVGMISSFLEIGGAKALALPPRSSRKSERRQQRAARRSMDDHSWIHASYQSYQSWTPQKQSLAREIHELSLTNKDQSRELAKALERSQQLEVSLNASNQAHSNFENLAERSRSELEQAYLGALDREVNMANQVLVQESQLQAHQASEILEQRIAGVTSQAQAAMANMAASSDQRLAEAAQENQRRPRRHFSKELSSKTLQRCRR